MTLSNSKETAKHLKWNDYRTLCGLRLDYGLIDVVELPEEATCGNCLRTWPVTHPPGDETRR